MIPALVIRGCAFITCIGLTQIGLAQINPNSPPPPPAPISKSVAAPKTATSTLKVTSNEPCNVYMDGEPKGTIVDDRLLKIELRPGQYQLKAVSTVNASDFRTELLTIATSGTEQVYAIDMQQVIQARISAEVEMAKQTLKHDQEMENERLNALRKMEAKAAVELAAQEALSQLPGTMIRVTGGLFTMGCTPEQRKHCRDEEKPSRKVTVTDFLICKFEVTRALWWSVMQGSEDYVMGCPNCPVDGVSWNEVHIFIEKLNQRTGMLFRLPTEAEWEYAARGGILTRRRPYAGSVDPDSVAWHAGNSQDIMHPVGSKAANELGLYDMSGNVWEWCQDVYAWYRDYHIDPWGYERGTSRSMRGGDIRNPAEWSRVSNRWGDKPATRLPAVGFRLARSE